MAHWRYAPNTVFVFPFLIRQENGELLVDLVTLLTKGNISRKCANGDCHSSLCFQVCLVAFVAPPKQRTLTHYAPSRASAE